MDAGGPQRGEPKLVALKHAAYLSGYEYFRRFAKLFAELGGLIQMRDVCGGDALRATYHTFTLLGVQLSYAQRKLNDVRPRRDEAVTLITERDVV